MKAHITIPYTEVIIEEDTRYSPPVQRKVLKDVGYDNFLHAKKPAGHVDFSIWNENWVSMVVGDKEVIFRSEDIIRVARFFGKA